MAVNKIFGNIDSKFKAYDLLISQEGCSTLYDIYKKSSVQSHSNYDDD